MIENQKLLERFYGTQEGFVLLNAIDIFNLPRKRLNDFHVNAFVFKPNENLKNIKSKESSFVFTQTTFGKIPQTIFGKTVFSKCKIVIKERAKQLVYETFKARRSCGY